MKITIRQIAKETGVSITTVSRIVNGDYSSVGEDTKNRVIALVEKYDYRPNRSRKTSNGNLSTVVGVILPASEPFFIDVACAIYEALNSADLDMVIKWSNDDFAIEAKNVEKLVNIGVLGVLYMSTTRSPKDCYGQLSQKGLPFVVLDSYLKEYSVPAAVFVDGASSIYEMTNLLISKGHRNIAYISGISYDFFSHNRYQGYVRALLENGITVDPSLSMFGEFSVQSGSDNLGKLIELGKPFSAVVCENDMIALGAMEKAFQMEIKVPDDISITGFDDTLISRITYPKLTTIKQPIKMIAEKAVELLQAQIRKERICEKIIVLPSEIVLRESVKDLNTCFSAPINMGNLSYSYIKELRK